MHIDRQGSGPDLVLIHGWAMHSGIFAPLVRVLAPHFRLHLVDLPGHGFSRDESERLELADSARHIAKATPRAIWLGWSLGGLIALHAALNETANLRGLVMAASSPRFVAGGDWPLGIDRAVIEEFSAGLAQDYQRTIERFLALEAIGSDQQRNELRDLKAQVFERGEPAIAALKQGLHILETADLRADLGRNSVPNLWIAGRRDRLINPAAMRWAAGHAHGRYLECNSGHAPFLAHASAFADAIAGFAAELPA